MAQEISGIAAAVAEEVAIQGVEREGSGDSLVEGGREEGEGWRVAEEKDRVIEGLKGRLKAACDASISSIKEGARQIEEKSARIRVLQEEANTAKEREANLEFLAAELQVDFLGISPLPFAWPNFYVVDACLPCVRYVILPKP